MKILHVILFIFLICKSTFGMSVVSAIKTDCNTENKQIAASSIKNCTSAPFSQKMPEHDQQKGCCGDGVCDCLCCGHVFINKPTLRPSIMTPKILIKHLYHYKNNYLNANNNSIWQPPRNN